MRAKLFLVMEYFYIVVLVLLLKGAVSDSNPMHFLSNLANISSRAADRLFPGPDPQIEPHSTSPASQQQGAFMLVHRTGERQWE